jgi:hypothetical protein
MLRSPEWALRNDICMNKQIQKINLKFAHSDILGLGSDSFGNAFTRVREAEYGHM